MNQSRRSVEYFCQVLQKHLPALKEQYQVDSLGIFGSYVRQEQKPESDLDVLVTFSDPPSLLTFIALEHHLSDLLGVPVDLVMRDALKPRLGQVILEEVIRV
jgi:hypothetical protein